MEEDVEEKKLVLMVNGGFVSLNVSFGRGGGRW